MQDHNIHLELSKIEKKIEDHKGEVSRLQGAMKMLAEGQDKIINVLSKQERLEHIIEQHSKEIKSLEISLHKLEREKIARDAKKDLMIFWLENWKSILVALAILLFAANAFYPEISQGGGHGKSPSEARIQPYPGG